MLLLEVEIVIEPPDASAPLPDAAKLHDMRPGCMRECAVSGTTQSGTGAGWLAYSRNMSLIAVVASGSGS